MRLEHKQDVTRITMHGFIAKTIKDEAEAIYTDELKSCLGIADHNTRHETVRDSIGEWVVGDCTPIALNASRAYLSVPLWGLSTRSARSTWAVTWRKSSGDSTTGTTRIFTGKLSSA